MTASNDVVERIAEVVQLHQRGRASFQCRGCDWEGHFGNESMDEAHAAHVAAAVVAELQLTEEAQIDYLSVPSTPLIEAGGIEIRTARGQGWAECGLCGQRESGCYADLAKWADDHAEVVHDQQPYPMRRRWVTGWERQ